uniref:FERM domain-containing protein n=1 Tax=Caenorhabditis japonica TaxID=281687 RepID=A0A8R1E1M6_CAEJA
MSNIPRGVGAPPPPGMNSSKRGRLVCIKVRMLDDTVAVFHLGVSLHKAIGQTLLDEVCRHLNLLECDYFGLSFIDANGNHCWLDREKTILRQITHGTTDAKFYFIVKFYTPNPIDLEEEYTRYLFTMQIKRDLALGELHCSDNTAALLSAYLVQSECGDFSSEDYPDATYLSHSRFVPNQSLEFQKKVMDNHRNFIGMTPGESDLAMLEVARRCDFYGVKLHGAKDVDGNDAALSVMHLGIKVFRQLQLDTTFSWARIRKLSFKRKKLLVKLHPDSYQYLKETVELSFDTRDECKNFWKKCVEHHAFFRCVQAEEPRKETRFFISKGSSFRYHGRTQKQLIDYVREHHKRREPFTRPLRSAASTRKGTYSSTYGLVSDRPSKQRNGSVYEPNQADGYNKQNTHSSMPHIAHISSQPTDHAFSDSVERPQRSNRPISNAIVVPSNVSKEQPDLSVSLPNVLSDDLQMVCKEIELEQKDPPKSVSGDNFQERRSSRDYDNVSEDSYRLSDHERSTRSEVGVGSKHAAATIFNSTFVARKPGSNVVKRVVVHSKSTPNSTDEEEGSALKSVSEYQTFRHIKEYPFVKNANIVPIEIDGPNVDFSARRSPAATTVTTRPTATTTTTVTTTSKVLTSSGAVLMRPKVIPNDKEPTSAPHSSRVSPESGTYGALGPLPGRVLTKENIVITPEGMKEKKPKPNPPPKPTFPIQAVQAETEVVREVKTERASSHPLVHLQEEIPFSRAPLKFEEKTERKSSLSRPALISVQSEDNPDVQKCHLFNSDIPYTLTMRNVESTQSLPYSTFKDLVTAKKQEYESNSLKRVSKSPEFKRRKSLDLVPRKRLPSPGNFSAQDHTITPSTPDSDVLEYLLRRRSLLGDKTVIKTKNKRTDPRRQTQPVRFDLPPSPCSPTAGGSTPFISILNDDIFDECVSESRSLHEDMDRLDKTTPHNQSISSFMSQKFRRDSEESDVMPPPPDEVLNRSISVGKPAPPPPPPKSLAAAVKVAEMKAAAAGKIMYFSENQKDVHTDSPPFIDDSPKNSSASEATTPP